MENVEAIVAKSGEDRIRVCITRGDGLLVKVWAQPNVEDFIRSLGSGTHIDVQTIGRHWWPAGKDKEKKLMVYEMTNDLGIHHLEDKGFGFRLDHPGYPLIEGEDSSDLDNAFAVASAGLPRQLRSSIKRPTGEVLNLGFLRFVGISDVNGVSFAVKGVYTREGVDNLASRIEQACSRFYREYLKPYGAIVTVSTMPIRAEF